MRRRLVSPQLSSLLLRPFTTTTTTTTTTRSTTNILTPDDLTQINTLILRLSDSNHFQESIRLLSVSLLAVSPPFPSSLPSLPLLIDRLATATNTISSSMSLLTTLRHHNPPPSPALPFCSHLLISSYLRHHRLNEASKVFSWLLKEDSPCRPDTEAYRIFVRGFSEKSGRAVEVVRAVREMVRDGVEVGEDVRGWVWNSMLREARIDEAKELDAALGGVAGRDGVGELMDRIIREWQD